MKNPLFRAIGVSLVVYFALFSDKDNPDSLGSIMSPQNIKSEIRVAKEKSKFIISNVSLARQMSQKNEDAQRQKNKISADIEINNIKIGSGEYALKCGDEANIRYRVYGDDNETIQTFDSEKITIDESDNNILNRLILGMKKGGIISAQIPYKFQSKDKELAKNMTSSKGGLRYQVTLLSITGKQIISCK